MDVESLRYVVTLAEELHFGRSAQRHFLDPGHFSRRVQRLERDLGARLFDRTSRRVTLTPAGERVVAHARAVLAALDRLPAVAGPPPEDDAVVRVGVLGFGAADRWPALRDVVTATAPGVRLLHEDLDMDDQGEALARSGGKVSISVETELDMGMGRPVFERCRRHGLALTLSADVISLDSGDLWHQMRFGLGFDRWDATHPVNLSGRMPGTVTTTARDALTWTTGNAAEAMGMGDRIGSLTPGKRGDVVVVGGGSFEMHPRPDVYGSLVFQTTVADVRTVLVDGRVVKRDGMLVDHDLASLARQADAVCDGVLGRLADAGATLPGTPENGWDLMEPLFQANRPQPVAP